MRAISAYFLLLTTFGLFACKKDLQLDHSKSKEVQTDSSSYISWKTCSVTNFGNDIVKICFDSLLEDSRCPADVECFWQGTAVAKFLFSVNSHDQLMTLSTFNLPGIYPSDTILMGYKIEFIDLRPYPQVNVVRNLPDYKAKVKITKQ